MAQTEMQLSETETELSNLYLKTLKEEGEEKFVKCVTTTLSFSLVFTQAFMDTRMSKSAYRCF